MEETKLTKEEEEELTHDKRVEEAEQAERSLYQDNS